ncbi:MAG: hypothetical protein MZV63_57435 [Marinilabiliales bacterium]|nr:hypothetical protein [Marinilabiliales bacterium]
MGDRIMAGEVIVRFEDREFVNSVKIEAQELNLEVAQSELQKQEIAFEKGGLPRENLRTPVYPTLMQNMHLRTPGFRWKR